MGHFLGLFYEWITIDRLQIRGNYPSGLDRNGGGINKRTCGIRGLEPRPGPGEALSLKQRSSRGCAAALMEFDARCFTRHTNIAALAKMFLRCLRARVSAQR
jgi:hypothetical protein